MLKPQGLFWPAAGDSGLVAVRPCKRYFLPCKRPWQGDGIICTKYAGKLWQPGEYLPYVPAALLPEHMEENVTFHATAGEKIIVARAHPPTA
jgi:hypothetical protein